MKKFTALLLIFSLMMLSANLYAKERRGAKLIVTKLDGQLIEGELITVKPSSLLLLDRKSGADVSVNIADIKVIRIVKKSKAGVGFLVGGCVGAFIGFVTYKKHPFFDVGQGRSALIVGIAYGLIGLVIGLVAVTDKTIQIEGMTDFHEFREVLEYLRKKARIRDYK